MTFSGDGLSRNQDLARWHHPIHLSHEKRATGWLGYIGDEILSSWYGDYFINYFGDPVNKQPVFYGEYPLPFFFFVAHLGMQIFSMCEANIMTCLKSIIGISSYGIMRMQDRTYGHHLSSPNTCILWDPNNPWRPWSFEALKPMGL